jgi:hypothetical protein
MSEPKNLLAPSRREARLTLSPITVYSIRACDPMLPTTNGPELMPMRAVISGCPWAFHFSRRWTRAAWLSNAA